MYPPPLRQTPGAPIGPQISISLDIPLSLRYPERMDTPIGPAPTWRPALPAHDDVFEAPDDLFSPAMTFGSQALSEYLLQKALMILDGGSEKARTKVLHDLLEVQGLLNKRPAKVDEPDENPAITQNILVANPALADALGTLARGLRRSEEPPGDR